MHTCCFFGMDTLPDNLSEEDFELRLYALVQGIFARGITHFVTSLRPGVDSICAEYVRSLHHFGARLQYIAGQEDLEHARRIISVCSHILAVYEDPLSEPVVLLALDLDLTMYALTPRQLIDRDSGLFAW